MIAVIVFLVAFIILFLGYICGGYTQAIYWSDHEKDGGTIYFQGRYYRVFSEHDANELTIRANREEQ
jgi:hypothetical protein